MWVPFHLTVHDTNKFTPWSIQFGICKAHLRLCLLKVLPLYLSNYDEERWFRHYGEAMYLTMKKIGVFHQLVSQYLSPSNSRLRSQCQMLMNVPHRSKLVMDTFIDWALDLPDNDVCFLAPVSHQISGRSQLKSAKIISQTGSLLYTGSLGAEIDIRRITNYSEKELILQHVCLIYHYGSLIGL